MTMNNQLLNWVTILCEKSCIQYSRYRLCVKCKSVCNSVGWIGYLFNKQYTHVKDTIVNFPNTILILGTGGKYLLMDQLFSYSENCKYIAGDSYTNTCKVILE